jgi:hypothetical protein
LAWFKGRLWWAPAFSSPQGATSLYASDDSGGSWEKILDDVTGRQPRVTGAALMWPARDHDQDRGVLLCTTDGETFFEADVPDVSFSGTNPVGAVSNVTDGGVVAYVSGVGVARVTSDLSGGGVWSSPVSFTGNEPANNAFI